MAVLIDSEYEIPVPLVLQNSTSMVVERVILCMDAHPGLHIPHSARPDSGFRDRWPIRSYIRALLVSGFCNNGLRSPGLTVSVDSGSDSITPDSGLTHTSKS